MKHAREDYNRIQDPANLIPADEPVFLLRGQDQFAPKTVEFWAKLMRDHDCDRRLVIMALTQAYEMRTWQEERACKRPDLPSEKYQAGDRKESEDVHNLRKSLDGQEKRLIVKQDSLATFLSQWLANPNDIINSGQVSIYGSPGEKGVTVDLLTNGGTNIPIKKGLKGTRVIVITNQILVPLKVKVMVSMAYQVEDYDDVCDKLVRENTPLEIAYPRLDNGV